MAKIPVLPGTMGVYLWGEDVTRKCVSIMIQPYIAPRRGIFPEPTYEGQHGSAEITLVTDGGEQWATHGIEIFQLGKSIYRCPLLDLPGAPNDPTP